ncbi:MAG: GNAT family N-acetyltransferase [Candidatus Bathyarchaeota archaeon]|nr:GNAT family N-acetyltransferase [Candidatus Bathyarchaeota archaeon]
MISREEVQGFIECYREVFRSLKSILPDDYVDNQIKKASSSEFHDKMLKELSDEKNILMVSTEENEITGMAWGNIKEDGSSWLSFLGVLPAFRRRGVGKSLLTRFIEESRDQAR